MFRKTQEMQGEEDVSEITILINGKWITVKDDDEKEVDQNDANLKKGNDE